MALMAGSERAADWQSSVLAMPRSICMFLTKIFLTKSPRMPLWSGKCGSGKPSCYAAVDSHVPDKVAGWAILSHSFAPHSFASDFARCELANQIADGRVGDRSLRQNAS
jgi:hypothetical protein